MTTFKVQVQPSGREFTAQPDQTVLAAALAAGITLPHACQDGACGTCKGRVLAGRIEQGPHAESALSGDEATRGYALLCCALPLSDLVLEVRVPTSLEGIVARRMPARIERIERPVPDVAILTLKLPAGEQLLFRAGQYVDFLLPGGERRSYSIASPPGAGGPLEFHIRHQPGGVFTDTLFGLATPALVERAIVRIEGPLGNFHLHEDDTAPIVLLAGGTGFAPLKAIAETIFAKGLNRDDGNTGRPGRSVTLYWGARRRPDLYLDALPRRWAAEEPNFRYIPVLSEPVERVEPVESVESAKRVEPARDGADAVDGWSGRAGWVHHAVMADLPDLSAHQVYACGVPAMVDAARRDFIAHCGLRAVNFHADAFVSRADLAAARVAPQ
jgi:CDP-4-dehydro-6-deoxyglucose reductase